ncbi:hypothetical protein BU17DRAFT_39221 [Hysterangium stoloniferum]|nr:hypothetical protein BU17DRAFT_39221 [Hysterangium stoloniferum]
MTHKIIVSAILEAIALPYYKPPMPYLDSETWCKILDWKKHERRNNFFEWLGDSLLSAAISVELCRQVPYGTEHIFTQVRSALAANKTFSHLTLKMDVLSNLQQWREGRTPSKLFADFFEVVAAEVYRKFGFEVLCEWVRDVFSPLITAALIAYKESVITAFSSHRFHVLSGYRSGP